MVSLLKVLDLKTWFFTRRGIVKAVDGVSFSLSRGETLGLVGESGCGKTMTCLSIVRMVPKPAGRIVGGQVLFEGEDLLCKREADMIKIRGCGISMIVQEPMTALNPAFTVGDQVRETIASHQKVRGRALQEKAEEILGLVRIPSPQTILNYYPHQLSGGMTQRVVGAIALVCEPRLLIADEPTTSLDVTTQDQYLRLLKEIQQRLGVAMIFVTHDFGVIARMCDRVAVMYAGRIVESADTRDLFNHPTHPYTLALLRSLPEIDVRVDKLYSIKGQPPSLIDLPPGCSFAPRCEEASERCRLESPPLVRVTDDHSMSCWRSQRDG